MQTVKVRIAVAIDPKGKWCVAGWSSEMDPPTDESLMSIAIESVNEGELHYFVEAELPIPEAKTVQGTVVKGNET